MARARDPNRDKAFEIYKQHNGDILIKDIAAQLGKGEGTVRGWKNKDDWDGQLNGTFQSDERNAPIKNTERSNEENDISWIEIETEYVTDIRKKPCTFKDLAEKYGVSTSRVGEYASQHEWTSKREKHRKNTVKKTTEKIAELTSDDAAQATVRHFTASNKLLEILEGAINKPGEFNKVVEKLRVGEFGEEEVQVVRVDALAEKRLATVVTSLANIQKMQRETLDIMNAREEAALEKTNIELETLKKNDGNQVTKVVFVDDISGDGDGN